ncbi:MAG: hypothetical protein RL033_6875 [Pseudomonadota bacterium]
MTAFTQYVRTIVEDAGYEAGADGSATIEAQHVLVAIAARSETKASQFLCASGLTPQSLRDALHREWERSLSTTGASLQTLKLERGRLTATPVTSLGPSVQQALERGVSGLRSGAQPAHLLLGILRADIGIVPRALELAGYDRADLLTRAREALAGEC